MGWGIKIFAHSFRGFGCHIPHFFDASQSGLILCQTTCLFYVMIDLALLHKMIKIASVIADIRRLLAERPFVPFSVYCTDGGVVRILTVDHAVISPTGRRVIVFFDDDTAQYLSPLHISRVAVGESPGG
jgi:hypothetical protein